MLLSTFVLSSLAVVIKLYAEYYQLKDFNETLKDLEHDDSLPRIKTYDFIIGIK